MDFELFIAKANAGNMELPHRDVQMLAREAAYLAWENLRGECQNYIDFLVKARLRICKLALDVIITPAEFAMIMGRIDDIEDAFRVTELTVASLAKAKHQTNLVLDLLKITLGNNPSTHI